MDLALVGMAAAAPAYAALAFVFARSDSADDSRDWRSARLLSVACWATAAWAAASAWDRLSNSIAPSFVAAGLDVARHAVWFGLMLAWVRPAARPWRSGEDGAWLWWASGGAVLLAAVAWGHRLWLGAYRLDATHISVAAGLTCGVVGLALIEQLFRRLPPDARWGAKPLCVGLAVGFAFDIYLFSEGLMLGRLDPDASSVRGLIHLLALPFLVAAAGRGMTWSRKVRVSRTFAFQSATLILTGAYLLFMSAVGYYVRYFGGDWGRALQLATFAAALSLLLVIALSGTLRSRLKVFVGKHFFSYRYDYREEWLRFTQLLGSKRSPQEVGELVVRGLAQFVECPGGDLWTRTAASSEFRQSARWNRPEILDLEPVNSPFSSYLSREGWVIDLHQHRQSPRIYGELALPAWLLARNPPWLVVPLIAGDELLGFVTLSQPRSTMELDWEVRDLLKTAAQQAAGHLAQMYATEALMEARKFEAFNRMSAFVVHDLKNIVTQLSLMSRNAQRLHANPEFQQDMLLTVESSLEKMRRLMLQLREGATPPGVAQGVELRPMFERLSDMARGRGRRIEVDCEFPLATRGHEDRLERVIGHLVQNALDATRSDERVWIRARRHSGQVKVEIGDTGVGMDAEFVRSKLFRPFSTTKQTGMGIGSYESYQYFKELGGTIDVDSRPEAGTVMHIVLPLFLSAASDSARGEMH